MPHRFALVLTALLALRVGASAHAASAVFPQAAGATAPERSVTLRLGGGETVSVASYRFKPKPGLTRWAVAEWCGVTIGNGHAEAAPILVIGTGATGTVRCLGLMDAGPMPPHGAEQRVGLIYRTASPNFPGVTPVLLASYGHSAGWRIDHSQDDALSRILPVPTLDGMRRLLLRHRQDRS